MIYELPHQNSAMFLFDGLCNWAKLKLAVLIRQFVLSRTLISDIISGSAFTNQFWALRTINHISVPPFRVFWGDSLYSERIRQLYSIAPDKRQQNVQERSEGGFSTILSSRWKWHGVTSKAWDDLSWAKLVKSVMIWQLSLMESRGLKKMTWFHRTTKEIMVPPYARAQHGSFLTPQEKEINTRRVGRSIVWDEAMLEG